ncbi:hypothetical protein P3W45_000874 [Vairimorpha bombi]|jgi:MFS family permease
MNQKIQAFLFSVVAALSSFLFGLFLTSESVLYDNLESNYVTQNLNIHFKYYKSLFVSIIFLGAFFSSCFNYLGNMISRKYILIANNILYLLGALIICFFDNIYLLLFCRFIVGMAAGISCCNVPNYIFSTTDDKNRGFYMSFNSIGIVLGLVVGQSLGVYFGSERWFTVYIYIASFIFIHTMLLCLIRNSHSSITSNDTISIAKLIKDRRARKSIFLAISFHFAQHACGIDYFSIFSEEILKNQSNPGLQGTFSLVFSAIISIISCNFIDKVGRKIFIVLSTSVILVSTFLMGFNIINLPIILFYLFGFNIGMASIPWFITNEIFPVEYMSAAMRLAVGVNWFSAFILSFINTPLHEKIGHYMFFFYTFVMSIFLAIVITTFKETKNRPVGFQ